MTTHTTALDAAQALGIQGFVSRYTPESLTPEEWAVWRARVLNLVLELAPASRNSATVAASALSEAIAESGAAPDAPWVSVLRDEVIQRVANERQRRGRSKTYVANTVAQLRRLQAAALGLPGNSSGLHSHWSIGGRPTLEGLRNLANDSDDSVRESAQQLLEALSVLKPRPWVNPLPASTWRKFRASPQVTNLEKPMRWRNLKSERVWEEMHSPTPTITLLSTLKYSAGHWNLLAGATFSDVQAHPDALRGCKLGRSTQWIVKDAPMPNTQAPEPRRQNRRTKPSQAEARRIAREFLDALYGDPAPLTPDLEALLQTWKPKEMPPADWLACKDLVHEIMRRSHIRGVESFRKHMRMLAAYVSWATSSGYPEDMQVLMTGDAINDYARSVLAESRDATPGTTRSKLRALARAVNPEKNLQSLSPEFRHNDARPPYTQEDLYWLERRIELVRQPTIRRAIQSAVALGLGAGLSTGDLQSLRRCDISDHGETGICVTTVGKAQRSVWVRREYEHLLRDSIGQLSANERILGRRHHKDTVRDLYRYVQPTGEGPQIIQSRLRHTWLAKLMCEPIPMIALLRVAGLSSASTLTDLAPYIHEAIDERALRGVA